MSGIVSTLKTIAAIQSISIDAIKTAKDATGGPFKIVKLLGDVARIGDDVKELVADAPAALPELKDIDASEAGQIAEASFGLVKAILAALVA
jgi:hypothetical protein